MKVFGMTVPKGGRWRDAAFKGAGVASWPSGAIEYSSLLLIGARSPRQQEKVMQESCVTFLKAADIQARVLAAQLVKGDDEGDNCVQGPRGATLVHVGFPVTGTVAFICPS